MLRSRPAAPAAVLGLQASRCSQPTAPARNVRRVGLIAGPRELIPSTRQRTQLPGAPLARRSLFHQLDSNVTLQGPESSGVGDLSWQLRQRPGGWGGGSLHSQGPFVVDGLSWSISPLPVLCEVNRIYGCTSLAPLALSSLPDLRLRAASHVADLLLIGPPVFYEMCLTT